MKDDENHGRLVFKTLYILKRHMDKAAASRIASVVPGDFNFTFMPYFMNIGHEGISNHELVSKIMVTKQGVSKTIKELEKSGLVYTSKSETDARSIMIYLTEQGKSLYSVIAEIGDLMTEDYIKLVGAKKYESFINTCIQIARWHQENDKSM